MKPIAVFACTALFLLSEFAQRKIINQLKQAEHENKRLKVFLFIRKPVTLKKREKIPKMIKIITSKLIVRLLCIIQFLLIKKYYHEKANYITDAPVDSFRKFIGSIFY
jgi:hypothetical protein